MNNEVLPYEITLNTEEGNDYLASFLDEPLQPGTEVSILFEFDTGRCSFDFFNGTSSPEGWDDDWEGALDWLSKNGYEDEVAEINRLAEEWNTFSYQKENYEGNSDNRAR
jgi:hypothetical protein